MSFSATFIRRPIATMLLAIGILLAGGVAYRFLPVASLPSVDIPTIVVFAGRPGADPETMANSIAAPLERRLGEIAGVSEITSTSAVGSTSIVIQFELSRSIDGAAHDVQAAINAATPDLPSDLPTRPYFRKFNPAQAPIMTIALTSDTLSTAQIYDAADSILGQRLSQVDGVSQVQVNGSEKPAVRIRIDPAALAAAGLSGQDVFTTVRAANVDGALGSFNGASRAESIGLNNQISTAQDYRTLVLKSSGGAILRLSDVATVIDGVANTRLAAWYGKTPAILLTISKAVDANVLDTVAGVREVLPLLQSWLPPDIKLKILTDRTQTIRTSIDGIQYTLLLSVVMVLLVVLVFMRSAVPTAAAAVTVPLSLAGTLAAMWLCGFALDNFSLLALTIAVGFVVDDAIVMIENIVRHREMGKTPYRAAMDGAGQIGFTIVSISLSLVAVFIPILFMGGILGRLFREFSGTIALAIGISAVISLTVTPMICGRFMPSGSAERVPTGLLGRIDRGTDRILKSMLAAYARTLGWALRRRRIMIVSPFAILGLIVVCYMIVPKGFFPDQDTGLMQGATVAGPEISFAAMAERQRAVVDVLLKDPAIDTIGSTIGVSSGWSALNRGQLTIGLKPLNQRHASATQIMTRLRPQLEKIGGIQTYLWAAQDLRGGGRSGASNEFVLLDEDLDELRTWTQKLEDKLRGVKEVTDVNSDQDRPAPQANVVIDRVAAARLGVSVSAIDNALNNAFAQRQISIIYTQCNQYRVVEEVDPRLQTDPTMLDRIFVGATTGPNAGKQVPLGAVTRVERTYAPLAVRHQGQFPAATVSFNQADGVAQGTALAAVKAAADELHMPETIHTDFAGNSKFLSDSLSSQPALIAAAFLAIYIVLGVLYESWTQPLTIISTLPSAILGALVALVVTDTDLSIMGIIGVLLLMGIVKKNGIMLVDFALEEERRHGRTPLEAIRAACLERFRPIMMTTLAALLGALPLVFATGTGSELRTPLGISVAGGLIVSQALTLYTTPIIYLALQHRRRRRAAAVPSAVPAPAE